MVERLVRNEKARGSNPLTSSYLIIKDLQHAMSLHRNTDRNTSAIIHVCSGPRLLTAGTPFYRLRFVRNWARTPHYAFHNQLSRWTIARLARTVIFSSSELVRSWGMNWLDPKDEYPPLLDQRSCGARRASIPRSG